MEFQFRDEIFRSPARPVARKPDLEYENLDEAQDDVAFCGVRLQATLPVYQTSNQFELRLAPATTDDYESTPKQRGMSTAIRGPSFFSRKENLATKHSRAASPLQPKHKEKAKPPPSTPARMFDAFFTGGAPPDLLAVTFAARIFLS